MVLSGGLYKDLATIKDGEKLERHHLPGFKAYDGIARQSHGYGLSIEMLKADHRELTTTRDPALGEQIRNTQTAFLLENRYHLAFLKGVEEVVAAFCSKYDRGIVQAEGALLKMAAEKAQELQQAQKELAAAVFARDLKAQAEAERKVEQLSRLQISDQYKAEAEKRVAREAQIATIEVQRAELQADFAAGKLTKGTYQCLAQACERDRKILAQQQQASLAQAISEVKLAEQRVTFQAQVAQAEQLRSTIRVEKAAQAQQQAAKQVDVGDFARNVASKTLEQRVAEFKSEMETCRQLLPRAERILWTGQPPEKIDSTRVLLDRVKTRLDGVVPWVRELEKDLMKVGQRDPTLIKSFEGAKGEYEINCSRMNTLKSFYTEDFFIAQQARLNKSVEESQSLRFGL